jgi:hypothetical protein
MASKHQLARLIDGIKAANSWSDPDLVRNAKEQGHVLSKSNISRYRNPLVSIKGEIIYALAAGLRITPAQVATAAIESMGITLPAYGTMDPEQAIRLDTRLSDRDKDTLLVMLRQFRSSTATQAGTPSKAAEDQKTPGDLADDGEIGATIDAATAAAGAELDIYGVDDNREKA